MRPCLFLLLIMTGLMTGSSCHPTAPAPVPVERDSTEIKLAAGFLRGEALFLRHCAACHLPPEKKVTDNYMFVRLFDRMPSPSSRYFIRYIQDSKSLREAGDAYAIALHRYWEHPYDHHFRDSMTVSDIRNLIVYIRVAASK
ncbi:Cytochrome c [Chitinophaga eiseniae]|uniref:Cytochrome c n=1 Tax=Chitinophaga eiseniae TaxID=634771 RepID=A0A1T4SYZ0_9BACT|nr:c-type cytochrome [Chitinophaga eiseniae]SKA33443.1 Cytochrome c [Chitinophaga eiseniae]